MSFTARPVIMGSNGVVTSTHYLASVAGLKSLQDGGNVVDAGATMWFCLTLLKPHLVGPAGEVPILLYWADEEKVVAINGQGPAPMNATIDWFLERGYTMIPEDGFTPAVVPGSFDAWLITLEEYGTFTLGRVLEPALRIARDGFPIYPTLKAFLERGRERFMSEWPASAETYLPGGRVPEIGQLLRNPGWYNTFKEVAAVESRAGSRSAGLDAARKHFYDGPIAQAIVEFTQRFKCRDVYGKENHGLITLEDFQRYSARFEEPVTVTYRGLDVYKCGPWCQGPVFLQQLNLLEGYDLREMGHNTVEYLHTWIECAKLAFADREQYYADPDFVDVPLDMLLSKEYAKKRRGLVDPDKASMLFKPGGVEPKELEERSVESAFEGDTVHLDAIDRDGNMLAATPSGGWIRASPLVPGLGFPLGTRGQFFHLDPGNVECLEPGKKPSTTLTPSIALKDGRQYMAFGTPGGDRQDQWTLQFFLNHVEFGMNVQEALDAPTVHTNHVPGSFWPHAVKPGEAAVESRIPDDVIKGLKEKGHRIAMSGPWSHGRCLAIRYDADTGVMFGGASPRTGEPYALGW